MFMKLRLSQSFKIPDGCQYRKSKVISFEPFLSLGGKELWDDWIETFDLSFFLSWSLPWKCSFDWIKDCLLEQYHHNEAAYSTAPRLAIYIW